MLGQSSALKAQGAPFSFSQDVLVFCHGDAQAGTALLLHWICLYGIVQTCHGQSGSATHDMGLWVILMGSRPELAAQMSDHWRNLDNSCPCRGGKVQVTLRHLTRRYVFALRSEKSLCSRTCERWSATNVHRVSGMPRRPIL